MIAQPITTPTLLLDAAKCRANIARMAAKAKNLGVRFRPHFKTHQSLEIAGWFREHDVYSITVSSIGMAEYFQSGGWNDITVAFPVNILDIDRINALAKQCNLHLVVESEAVVRYLRDNLGTSCGTWIKIDTGAARTGIGSDASKRIEILLKEITSAPSLELRGLLTHAGHTYNACSVEEIRDISRQSIEKMISLQERFSQAFGELEISVGDTPGCSVFDDYSGVDEIRPGNFVFYDVMQTNLGVCDEMQIAVGLACPVVAKHESRLQVVVHGGAVHLSKEFTQNDGHKCYGTVCYLRQGRWSDTLAGTRVVNLSQEHGVLQTSADAFTRINIGDILVVLPVHSCLTANLMGSYLTLDGQFIAMRSPRIS